MNHWTESPAIANLRQVCVGHAARALHEDSTSWFHRAAAGWVLIALIALFGLGCGHERAHVDADHAPVPRAQRAPSPEAPVPAVLEVVHSTTNLAFSPPETDGSIQPASRRLQLSPGRRSSRANAGMVVSVSEEATRSGLSVLEAGGNAIDAAVAAALTLAVTHPSAGNLGGGGFALVRLERGNTVALDFRESSPHQLDRGRFERMIRNGGEGPDSVAIPGSVAGLYELWSRYGKLPFAELVAPARKLAEDGHRIGPREAQAIRTAWPKLKLHPIWRKLYGTNQGRPLPESSWLRLPALAQTLRVLESQGMAGFYSGSIADSIVRSLGPNAQITTKDLEGYRAIWRQPLLVPYRGVRVVIMPPPSAGGVALAASLALLSHYDPQALKRGSIQHAHVLLEVMRRAQADRIFKVVDPDSLSAAERASQLTALLDPERWLKRHPIDLLHSTPNEQIVADAGLPNESENTTHLAAIDGHGLAVSLTTTLSAGFGAKVISDSGVVLNNSLASFSLTGPNQPRPNRRTTSSMAPTLVEDTQGLRLVLGTPGGDTIPSTLLQLVNAFVDYGVALDSAVDAPRLHQDVGNRGLARIEGGHSIPSRLRRDLERLGHRFCQPTQAMGHANTIAIIDGFAYGYADPREGGLALGRNRVPR